MSQLVKDTTVILLGSGNVATHFGHALKKAGCIILQVYSPTLNHARALAQQLKAEAVNQPSKISDEADLYILAVNDDAIAATAKHLQGIKKMIVHTAGSVTIDALKPYTKRCGVLYPLQTFSKKRKLDFKQIPLCIEASSPASYKQLHSIASALSKHVYKLNSEQRAAAHLAAVFANNFSNHMFAIAEEILKENKLSFDLIRPLIAETAAKIQNLNPDSAQTGPAKRNDRTVIQKQLRLLKKHPDLQRIYRLVSASIHQHQS